MSRTNFGGPKLPKVLLDKVDNGRIGKQRGVTRKDRRKQERIQKKASRTAPIPQQRARVNRREAPSDDDDEPAPRMKVKAVAKTKAVAQPTKSILKQRPMPSSDEEEESEDDGELELGHELAGPTISRSGAKAKLEDDDAEIAALEKKLGMKKSKKSGDDELDWLVYGSDDDSDSPIASKRKRPEDDNWLKNKRRKAAAMPEQEPEDSGREDDPQDVSDGEFGDFDNFEDSGEDDGHSEIENPFSEDELSEDDFEGFDEDDENEEPEEKLPSIKTRENPYVAPVPMAQSDAAPAKYVPPSMRKAPSSDEEGLIRLRRQSQGLLNRLSDANLISILGSVHEVYANNARQYVTSTLVDLLKNLICDPAVLNDPFLILHAGFAAALYRTVGTDFGAQMLEAIVQTFDEHYNKDATSGGKQSRNLLAFLSNLYTLNAISSDIIFDYIRMLLERENFSENSTELLLRVILVAGQQLRSDDPTALKDIVLLLHRTINSIGKEKVSVRTQFMVETIDNLKNNRMKTGVTASALSAEHIQRMKKTLGTIKHVKTTEPLRITLADLRDADKKGKWWLVGASWQPKNDAATAFTSREQQQHENKTIVASSDAENGEVDLEKLAREQGMNTDVRRAIFMAVTGAIDPEHAFLRLMKLNLKNKQQTEIPRVLLHCVGAEPVYNHFYTLVACRFCSDHKMWKAWQLALSDIFKRLGESIDDSNNEESTEQHEEMGVKKVYNLAKLYAALVAEGLLRTTILKLLDFGALSPRSRIFVETFLVTVIILHRKKAHKEGFEAAVMKTFEQAHAIPEMIPGLKYYLTTIVPRSEIVRTKRERKVVEVGCEYAIEVLNNAKERPTALEDGLNDEE